MAQVIIPSKERVREWMNEGVAKHRAPPDPIEIRRQLEWRLSDQKSPEYRFQPL